MELSKHAFNIVDDFLNDVADPARLASEIRDSEIVTALSHITTEGDYCNVFFKNTLPAGDSTILDEIIATHTGEPLPQTATSVVLSDEYRDNSGKLRVHQTSRQDGLAIHWSSQGDDRANAANFGGGNYLAHQHVSGGDELEHNVYVEFNGLLNESWIHEVVLTWSNCELDHVTVDIVPDTCTIEDSTGTTFNSYGPIIVPAAGDGVVNITSDVLAYGGGLVAKDNPSDPISEPSPAFWNADFDEETNRFENLTAAPDGDGEYNIFHEEITLNRTFNRIQLLGSGFQIFNSSDSDQLAHGLKLRCTFETTGEDHDWTVSGILVMHRAHVGVNADGTVIK